MPRRPRPADVPETLRRSLIDLLEHFEEQLREGDLRARVRALVPAFRTLRDLGSSLIPRESATSARERIRVYLLQYPLQIIDGDELMVISGIGEWARRVRELRVQFGWWIYSGVTIAQMAEDPAEEAQLREALGVEPKSMKPDQYALMKTEADRDAAHRWNVLNEIRRRNEAVKDKLLEYMRLNVGRPVSGEELIYLAKGRKEWTRRMRELRTEEGWPIATKISGRPDLAVGEYLLEEDRQAEEHDRHIPDTVRVEVLERDGYRCTVCGWDRTMLAPGDPRKILELHHRMAHVAGGANTVDNLVTLCNVHHDEEHRRRGQA